MCCHQVDMVKSDTESIYSISNDEEAKPTGDVEKLTAFCRKHYCFKHFLDRFYEFAPMFDVMKQYQKEDLKHENPTTRTRKRPLVENNISVEEDEYKVADSEKMKGAPQWFSAFKIKCRNHQHDYL
ncbi:hypothetical protein Ciccas_004709 [Cichlidogyrus casuarinus]|uniref:Uncharacterized protein n=1 Tax=Cichlidogyrus casuarinus TaxID=1844966 RepID=A0ABD2QE82_9PLAT